MVLKALFTDLKLKIQAHDFHYYIVKFTPEWGWNMYNFYSREEFGKKHGTDARRASTRYTLNGGILEINEKVSKL